ncbi:hypothetical protein OROHE_002473 [Orobanche hederae]
MFGNMEFMPDWSDLLPELLAQVSLRLPEMEDFMAFMASRSS